MPMTGNDCDDRLTHMTEDVPTYEHDCDNCRYLGSHTTKWWPEDKSETLFDLYVCAKQRDMPTVIARYGNDGPDYTSGLYHALAFGELTHPLVEAVIRAVFRAGLAS